MYIYLPEIIHTSQKVIFQKQQKNGIQIQIRLRFGKVKSSNTKLRLKNHSHQTNF